MVRYGRAAALVLCAGLAVSLVPPASALPLPLPGDRVETVIETGPEVEVSHVRLYDPLPTGAAPHPEECDYIDYLRYRRTTGPVDPQAADAVMVAQAGAWLGMYSMDRLARNTLGSLTGRGQQAEWWSLARRSVCAFDMRGLEAANEAQDGRVAFDYYFHGRPVDGRQFAGFKPDSELGYLADIGLAQNVHDTREVLVRGLPDPQFRATKTFCGGHSDGGLIMSAFGAWDFGGGRESAGYNQCAGFFAVDSLNESDPTSLNSNPAFMRAAEILREVPYDAVVSLLKSGALPRTYNGLPIIAPETMALLPLLGSVGHHNGAQETDVHRGLPGSPLWLTTTRLDFAASYTDFLSGDNALADYRFTGEALLGMLMDDHTLNLAPLQVSLGALAGGPVAPKQFPWPDEIEQVPGVAELSGSLTGPGTRVGPIDKQALYTWRAHDDVADVPYTTPATEVVDIQDFARVLSAAPGGPTGFLDPYYTVRYGIDIQAAHLGIRTGYLAPMRYDADVRAEPQVTIWGSDAWERRAIEGSFPPGTVVVDGYTHLDVVAGAANQNDGGPEPVSDALAGFVSGRLAP